MTTLQHATTLHGGAVKSTQDSDNGSLQNRSCGKSVKFDDHSGLIDRENLAFYFKDKSQHRGMADEHNTTGGFGYSVEDIEEILYKHIFPINLEKVKRSEFDQFVI